MNPEKPKSDVGQPAGILVVDDTPANLQILAGMLKDRGYKVRPVPSGKLALLAARRDPPDLILLDINMPEMNGYDGVPIVTEKKPTIFRMTVVGVRPRNGQNCTLSPSAETEPPFNDLLSGFACRAGMAENLDFGHAQKRGGITRNRRDLKASQRRVYGRPPFVGP